MMDEVEIATVMVVEPTSLDVERIVADCNGYSDAKLIDVFTSICSIQRGDPVRLALLNIVGPIYQARFGR